MVRNRLYYGIKPLLPWSVRMGIRRWFARRKLRSVADVWPIHPGSEKPPEGWPGWPKGKQFAFVLTHDVEGIEGLNKVRQLAELEMSLGFRSCFNFIPEGDYQVPAELRNWLRNHGFEVGVHDLKHDGRLFSNRQEFARSAPRINAQLEEWGASGFRAGFMLHQLDWLHDLNIQYDCSTFDTDPFEPQPQGQHTIFPFWVPRPSAHCDHSGARDLRLAPAPNSPQSATNGSTGYVELPYTLPQDSTLFLLLRENSPNIWLRKLDWIVQQGGMALVNIHPDYIRFPGDPASPGNYPVQHYFQLLEHLKARHVGNYWQPLPREMATFCSGFRPENQPFRDVALP